MKINKELMKGSTVILILTLLEQKPMYGYEMSKAMEKNSNGVLSLKEGTLYPILHTLESDGMVHSYWSEGEGERKRKYYEITPEGKKYLQDKKQEWVTFRTAVDHVLGGGQA
ncbi:PadR family transcriptional regulator [Brevibacillus reuszeri]|uniref:PadR family transcriptional regulator n=1 Tax=Brevibacillus reuszeri TaxID=54915 RepID=UPI000CCC81B6|nr:PadR family transcriptional regulator [Brevibacillus reuszeri]GIO09858.1 PadR family transcriptional regulator [Brevibacillus reuszeri]